MRVWLLTLLFALAGCTEPVAEVPEPEPEACAGDGICGQAAVTSEDGRDLRTDLTAQDKLGAPVWQVGDVFEQHMFFGADDLEGRHIQTMVIDDSSGYTIATTDPSAARDSAVYDFPILGHIGDGLETSFFGSEWPTMYQWPLQDGATWSGNMEQLINWNSYSFTDFDLTMTAQYDSAIDTPNGDFPGFWIDAVTADGDLLVRYNYVPAVGWFSHLWMYDIETEDPDDIMFHAMSMGTWKDFNGTYYTAEATSVLEQFWGVFPDPNGPAQGEPQPQDFTIPSDADHMIGIVVPIAVYGRTEVTLTEPDTETNRYVHQNADQERAQFSVFFVDEEAEHGTWNSRIVGTGVATGAYVWINAVTTIPADL